MLLGTRTGRGAGFPGRHDAPYHPAFGMARDSFMGLRHSENAYLTPPTRNRSSMLRSAYPRGTPSISPIPPEALVVVDVAEAASLRLSLVALTMLAAIPVRAHS